MIKNILHVEDGSVDLDELKANLTAETKIIVYRQGSVPPKVIQLARPIKSTRLKETNKTQRRTNGKR